MTHTSWERLVFIAIVGATLKLALPSPLHGWRWALVGLPVIALAHWLFP